MKKILLIDICGTITEKNTTLDFISYIGNKPSILKIIIGRICWRLFKKDTIRKWYLNELKGLSYTELVNLAREYVNQLNYDPQIICLINKHRGECDLYFVSATLDFIAKAMTEKFNVSGFFASELQFEDGICSGKLKIDLLDNKNSVIAHMFNGDNNVCIISDNYGDYSVMEKCCSSWAVVRNKRALHYWSKKSVNIINRM
ncbi:haloacid dehalogenase-like hydrolase [Escherichia coli]|jgi:hypothetical protein|uniref:Haloacid dehalogenase-like hydrolase n=9 Tax=Escherichia coli TaxID=562 RepID=A0A0B1DXL7_ECOLX|nr:haloacid dehalogenase-like hydrolase [Escherichia coli]EJT2765111.1 haloacid dehalogenase-like hydrolase [Shigella sonnei]EKH5291365.1 haloacid dehalogenase-like hydrolase [Escherichia coli O26]EKH6182561.1 haloacid dehalogenase-like hydrolase [Escherichia coli O111]EKH6191274.1 haloacid dehalogenase-like hydrolase [Escherichia coli O103]EKJ1982902.1 haloacid dehalogenase-like hydrolase [Escherichia coli O104]EKY3869178.1 haloacid dehalogenase-like hydrolase [Escherichia coli O157]ELQ0209